MTYELIPVQNFERTLRAFGRDNKEKIKTKIREMLTKYPERYEMLEGYVTVAGVNLYGLHRMKVGVAGLRGGAYILYRICGECRKNRYMEQSGKKCEFCDNSGTAQVVLFDVHPRGHDYAK